MFSALTDLASDHARRVLIVGVSEGPLREREREPGLGGAWA
jgi:hypothetical protein